VVRCAHHDGQVNDITAAFFDAARCASTLLERPEVESHWTKPSVLAEFTIAGLAGHLLRGIMTVETYLDAPATAGAPLSAVEYYQAAGLTSDPESKLNREIRTRGEEMAAGGASIVAAAARTVLHRLEDRLATEEFGRVLSVLGGTSITLEEYLRTRVVELVVHSDDLALSVGIDDELALAPSTSRVAIETMVALARARHGDLAVLRALTRRERDDVDALRVL
jgi:hypothetical protein